jgi:hypothetical protein
MSAGAVVDAFLAGDVLWITFLIACEFQKSVSGLARVEL